MSARARAAPQKTARAAADAARLRPLRRLDDERLRQIGRLPGGVEAGEGCVYPSSVANIGTQLTATGGKWKAYEQDMGNDPARESAACGRPALNALDETQKAEAGDGYATSHDPFVYFHSVIEITFDESDGPQSDSTACCNEQPGPGSPLPGITGPGGGLIGAVLL